MVQNTRSLTNVINNGFHTVSSDAIYCLRIVGNVRAVSTQIAISVAPRTLDSYGNKKNTEWLVYPKSYAEGVIFIIYFCKYDILHKITSVRIQVYKYTIFSNLQLYITIYKHSSTAPEAKVF